MLSVYLHVAASFFDELTVAVIALGREAEEFVEVVAGSAQVAVSD